MATAIKALTPIISILAVTAIALYALSQGIDGRLMAAGITAIAGLGGFILGKRRK